MELAEIIKSNVELDWVTLTQFGKLVGLPHERLYQAKDNWPENTVWQKLDNKLWFSLRGWNQWMSQQAIRKASEYEATALKLTSQSTASDVTSRSRTTRHRKTSPKRGSYELR